MTMPNRSIRLRPRPVATAATLALLAGLPALVACDTRNESTKALQSASDQMAALTSGGTAPAPDESTQKAMNAVVASVQGLTGDESKSKGAAAGILLAQAHANLGETPAAEAMTLDRSVRREFDKAEGLASAWASLNAAAFAAEAFDPSAAIAELTTSNAAKRAEAQAARAELARFQAEADEITRRKREIEARADELQQQYAAQVEQARGMSAIAAAPIIERAQSVWREAERARLDAARLAAQLDVRGPEAASKAAGADQLEKQVSDLANAIKGLESQRDDRRARGTAARNDAQRIAAELDQAVVTASKRLADEVVPAYVKAIDVFEKSARAATGAEQGAPGAARSASASARQSVAELYWNKAQALASEARFLERLSRVTPALPNASDYARRAEASNQAAKAALDSARENYEQAQRSAESAQFQGPARERLQKLGELLGRAAEVTGGKALDLSAGFGFAGASEASVRDLVAEARQAYTQYNDLIAQGRFADAEAMILGDDEAMAAYRSSNELAAAAARLDAAIKDKFPGKTLADALGPMAQMGMGADAFRGVVDISTMNFAVAEGGAVSATNPAIPGSTVLLREVDGTWKLDINPLKPMLAQAGPMLAPLTGVFTQLADSVTNGTITSPEAVGAELMKKLQEAMMNSMGG